MTEWWTYRPSDFLMFSPRIYWRLFESLNEAWWPLQPVVIALALAALPAWRRGVSDPAAAAGLVVLAVPAALAACWALSAWAFVHHRLAAIFWPAEQAALAFAAQALLLIAGAVAAGGRVGAVAVCRRRVAAVLWLWAAAGHPLLAAATGRPWTQAEVLGLAPDPTAIATVAWLLASPAPSAGARWLRGALWVVPLVWLLFSTALLATMGATVQALSPGLVVGLAGAAAVAGRGRRPSRRES